MVRLQFNEKTQSTEKLDSILGDILSNRYLNVCKEYDVISQWKDIVGEISEVTVCNRVENGVLYVQVSSSAWRQNWCI